MYRLWWAPGTAAMAVQAALEEVGAPYEAIPVDLNARTHQTPEYLRLNPTGRVPTLAWEGGAMFETAAIMLFLADRHPEARLMPGAGSAARAPALQWLVHLTNTVQQTFLEFYHPDWFLTDTAQQAALKASADRRLTEQWARIAAALTDHGPYMAGAAFSLADLYVHMLNRWSRNCATPAWTFATIRKLVEHVRVRPAVQRMMAAQSLAEPF